MNEVINTKKSVNVINKGGPSGGVYFITVVGAAVYFIHHSFGFWGMVAALIKAVVWPGIVVYHLLSVFHA